MPRKKTKKTFVFDTSVLLYSPNSVFKFGNHSIVIPLSVLDELDRFKSRGDDVGRNSRVFSRLLYDKMSEGDISTGVPANEEGGTIRVDSYTSEILTEEISKDVTDNRILGLCQHLKSSGDNVVLITKDINLIIKAHTLKLEARDYVDEHNSNKLEGIYTGITEIVLTDQELDRVYSDGAIQTDVIMYPHQLAMAVSEVNPKKTVFVRYDGSGVLHRVKEQKELWGIKPRNIEQTLCMDLLTDDNIKLVTVTGKSGSGKSLLTLAAGLHKVIEERKYQSLIITRPTISVGEGLGYLPGDLSEKLEPWMRPVRDCMSILFKTKDPDEYFENLVDNDVIRVEPLAYIRGRSFHDSFIIADEIQNLSRHEVKSFLTRCGGDSKVVMTGDTNQIDSPLLDVMSNGLTQTVERFKNEYISGHITLKRGERSTLASIAADIL